MKTALVAVHRLIYLAASVSTDLGLLAVYPERACGSAGAEEASTTLIRRRPKTDARQEGLDGRTRSEDDPTRGGRGDHSVERSESLEKYGFRVVAGNGERAIELVGSSRYRPDPHGYRLGAGMDGTEAAERILAGRDVPVVFLSSHTEPDIVERTERITSYGYVVKSAGITVLDASIKMAFKLFDANRKTLESEIKQNAMISNIADVIVIIDGTGSSGTRARTANGGSGGDRMMSSERAPGKTSTQTIGSVPASSSAISWRRPGLRERPNAGTAARTATTGGSRSPWSTCWTIP
jgi:CheY-like chemotaxis protein